MVLYRKLTTRNLTQPNSPQPPFCQALVVPHVSLRMFRFVCVVRYVSFGVCRFPFVGWRSRAVSLLGPCCVVPYVSFRMCRFVCVVSMCLSVRVVSHVLVEVRSYHVKSRACHVMSRHSCHVMSCHVVVCLYVKLYHVKSCALISSQVVYECSPERFVREVRCCFSCWSAAGRS